MSRILKLTLMHALATRPRTTYSWTTTWFYLRYLSLTAVLNPGSSPDFTLHSLTQGEDLPDYADALFADDVNFLAGAWTADSGDSWYSVIVHVPHTQMIIELVSTTSPGSGYLNLDGLESRISPRQETRFASTEADGILQAVAVTRAASNMSSIDYFYTSIETETAHEVNAANVSRKCYAWSGADADVCFVSRYLPRIYLQFIHFNCQNREQCVQQAPTYLLVYPPSPGTSLYTVAHAQDYGGTI